MFHPQVATPPPGGSLWPFGLRRTLRGAAPGGQRVRGRRQFLEVGETFQRCSKWCFPCFFFKVHLLFPRFFVYFGVFLGAHLMFFACECVNVMFVRRLSACHLPQASLANLSDRDRAVQKAENFIGCRGGRNLWSSMLHFVIRTIHIIYPLVI